MNPVPEDFYGNTSLDFSGMSCLMRFRYSSIRLKLFIVCGVVGIFLPAAAAEIPEETVSVREAISAARHYLEHGPLVTVNTCTYYTQQAAVPAVWNRRDMRGGRIVAQGDLLTVTAWPRLEENETRRPGDFFGELTEPMTVTRHDVAKTLEHSLFRKPPQLWGSTDVELDRKADISATLGPLWFSLPDTDGPTIIDAIDYLRKHPEKVESYDPAGNKIVGDTPFGVMTLVWNEDFLPVSLQLVKLGRHYYIGGVLATLSDRQPQLPETESVTCDVSWTAYVDHEGMRLPSQCRQYNLVKRKIEPSPLPGARWYEAVYSSDTAPYVEDFKPPDGMAIRFDEQHSPDGLDYEWRNGAMVVRPRDAAQLSIDQAVERALPAARHANSNHWVRNALIGFGAVVLALVLFQIKRRVASRKSHAAS